MKYYKIYKTHKLSLVFLLLSLTACEDYLEIDLPDDKIVSENVFNNEESAESALKGLYNEMSRASFSAGGANAVNVLGGLSSDNLKTTLSTQGLNQFEQNQLLSQNTYCSKLWASAYNIIYQTNSFLEGITASGEIAAAKKDKFIGEAKVIRAFVYFYLVNFYGEVPLVLTTDYRTNADIKRSPVAQVYQQILTDLQDAEILLEDTSPIDNRTSVDALTARALLARVHLYQENWSLAESLSTEVIQGASLQLPAALNEVFLANSQEAIWQLSPLGSGAGASHTREGNLFIIEETPNSLTPVSLTADLLATFSEQDQRKQQWISSFNGNETTFYFPFKYKVKYDTSGEPAEYSMLLRLAEQYLIRAEARNMQGNQSGAINDLDKIRIRAGLASINSIQPGISTQALSDSITVERRRELFTEWGHRWLDLKRQDKATEILAPKKNLWEPSDSLYPLAEEEIKNNPNLYQNPGY